MYFGSSMTWDRSSTHPKFDPTGVELMTSRSWQYTSFHWDACCNHSAINDFCHPWWCMFRRLYLSIGKVSTNEACIQSWICAPGTHLNSWVAWGSVGCEVCQTLLHMTGTWNRSPYLLILSPTLYLLDHILGIPLGSSKTFYWWHDAIAIHNPLSVSKENPYLVESVHVYPYICLLAQVVWMIGLTV